MTCQDGGYGRSNHGRFSEDAVGVRLDGWVCHRIEGERIFQLKETCLQRYSVFFLREQDLILELQRVQYHKQDKFERHEAG